MRRRRHLPTGAVRGSAECDAATYKARRAPFIPLRPRATRRARSSRVHDTHSACAVCCAVSRVANELEVEVDRGCARPAERPASTRSPCSRARGHAQALALWPSTVPASLSWLGWPSRWPSSRPRPPRRSFGALCARVCMWRTRRTVHGPARATVARPACGCVRTEAS